MHFFFNLSLTLLILFLLCLLYSIIGCFIYLKALSLTEYVFRIAITYLHFISITILFVFLCHFHLLLISFQIYRIPGLPWRLCEKESACQCRRHEFDPWFGKTPHAAVQLSSCAVTIEPVLQRLRGATTEPSKLQLLKRAHPEPLLHKEKSYSNEKP